MRLEQIKIKIGNSIDAKLTLYLQTDYLNFRSNETKPMILICPGGGYEHVSAREGEAIALQFLSNNCHAAVLEYDVARKTVFPQHLLELAEAVAYIREHAKEFYVSKDSIIVAGFSAGGHLAASLGCMWQEKWLEKAMEGRKANEYKPNGLILAYPVITSGPFAHRGSFERILEDEYQKGCDILGLKGEELLEYISLENRVTSKVPPVFMWHTFEDGAVPLENSLLFANALRKADVNFEYHVFPHGGHGYALGTAETAFPNLKEVDPQIPQWISLCKKWVTVNYFK